MVIWEGWSLTAGRREIRALGKACAYFSPRALRLLSPPISPPTLFSLSPWRVSQILRGFESPALQTCAGGGLERRVKLLAEMGRARSKVR